MKRTIGVCYYPEHWPEDIWATDARRMAEAGLSWVRIGEFAWSRMEPKPGHFEWDWLDRAIETLGAAGLKVILGTPTATPPLWMLNKHPDMLAHDEAGTIRKFGSRRHYCFSHDGYRQEARRITHLMAERYGKNPHIAAWQTLEREPDGSLKHRIIQDLRRGGANLLAELFERIVLPRPSDHGWDMFNLWKQSGFMTVLISLLI